MSERLRQILISAVAILAAFALGLWLTFPMGVVSRVIEAQAEKALDFKYDISIEKVRFSGISGIRMIGLEMIPTGEAPEGQVYLPTRFDSVRVNAGLLSLSGPVPRVRADIRVGEGRIRARLAPGEEQHAEISVELTEFPLQRMDVLRQITGMPFTAELSGLVELSYSDEMRLTGGNVQLSTPSLLIGPGAVRSSALRQVGGSLPITATDFGAFVAQAAIDGSALQIERLDAAGAHVQLDVSGRVDLREPVCASRVAMQLRLALAADYVEANGLSVPLSSVDLLRRSQTADGYVLSLSGLLCNLRPEPGALRGGSAPSEGPTEGGDPR